MNQDLVRYSRAGDEFHYRWAARRCLKLIYPNTTLSSVVIEGSEEKSKAGEYVIDVTEYYESDRAKIIKYFQLKHSTTQLDRPFTFSNFKKTLEGFAKRFKQHYGTKLSPKDGQEISFSIITNRPVNSSLKDNFKKIAGNKPVNANFKKSLEDCTKLKGTQLAKFCSILFIEDSHGDYALQREDLRTEIAQILAGTVDNKQVDTIVALVREKALPDKSKKGNKGVIHQEDILKRFDYTSIDDLFPAKPKWEIIDKIVVRKQHRSLNEQIQKHTGPFIIHAAGGVGKSVFTRQFIDFVEGGSVGIAYDCFGAGTYRNRSNARHKHRDALVQIANELAAMGLCTPLIASNTSSESDIVRKFYRCLDMSITALKLANPNAKIYLLVDAADNAEMAAREFNENCFAHELLAEVLPTDCKLIMLCRTERIQSLQPRSNVIQLALEPFSEEETLQNLMSHFATATEEDGQEFHRRTAGNPRVQANALDSHFKSVDDLLNSLAPTGTTVEDQINAQLQAAINRIKDISPEDVNREIDSLCLGLASLPPHIPINILAEAASVTPEYVKSFVADIGRTLWLSDSSVQFIDEPTETWFRQTFCANKQDYEKYLQKLEPLADNSTYIALALPQLYLQAEKYDRLIEIALSDAYLPVNNLLDARNVRVYRLQFAFKAALRNDKHKDAALLAMRAGEEVAGNLRQLSLLRGNIDLFVKLQDPERVQEVAFKRLLRGIWEGSENIYTAALFSSIPDYKGDARVFLRSALHWLDIYVEDYTQRRTKDKFTKFDIDEQELLEFSFTILNLDGVGAMLNFVDRFNDTGSFITLRALTKRLIEQNRFEVIDELLSNSNTKPYRMIAIVSELMRISRIPTGNILKLCLKVLSDEDTRIAVDNPIRFDDPIPPTIVDFLEACVYRKLPKTQILQVLNHYIPLRTSQMLTSEHDDKERTVYLKALAIRLYFSDVRQMNYDEIIPEALLKKKKDYETDHSIGEYKQIIDGLVPWYLLRLKVLVKTTKDFTKEFDKAKDDSSKALANRYRRYDRVGYEIARVKNDILIHGSEIPLSEIENIYNSHLKGTKTLYLDDRINILRAATYLPHLNTIRTSLEQNATNIISNSSSDGPEEISEYYIKLSRAVLVRSPLDATVYFNDGVDIVSKFGDEISDRWHAISSIANKASERAINSEQLAYRFIRCAEVVGENMREKHWNRSDAVVLCSRLSVGAGISALSRWRDRDVGYFERMLKALLSEFVKTKKIQPSVGWALAKLLPEHYLNEFVDDCLSVEEDSSRRQYIFNEAVYLLQIEGSPTDYWKELLEVGKKYSIANSDIDKICSLMPLKEPTKEPSPRHQTRKEKSWDFIFANCDVLTSTGLEQAHDRVKELTGSAEYGMHSDFWSEVFKRTTEEDIFKLIDAVLSSSCVDAYDFRSFSEAFPTDWRVKASFVKKWPEIVHAIGYRFCYELINRYSLKYFAEGIGIEQNLISNLKNGIIERLATGDGFNDASAFFGFISLMSGYIRSDEADEVLKYSLDRFELHIEDDFGDGEWSDWLKTDENVLACIAGLIWSALGSPRSAMRWNAAHTVRTLADLNCGETIDFLIDWLNKGEVGPYGSIKFPFYNLHARLYLFIALARVSLDTPALLKKHHAIFSKYVLEPHSLIQKYSFDIASNIETSFPGTYDVELFEKMSNAVKTTIPIRQINWGDTTDTIWHANNEIKDVKFHFGWDFDRYWFEPLGDVFGVSGKQVEDLAAQIVTQEWGLTEEQSGYYKDPRSNLWNSSSAERETSHSHGSYPRTHNLDFYHSYHAMFIAASQLLQNMAVAKSRDEELNPWEDWLSRHLLSRKDGKWLAELRDPLPLQRPKWVGVKETKTWYQRISDDDFFNGLVQEQEGEFWVNISGGWTEIQESREETYSVNVCIVNPDASASLMHAINTCTDPYDYYLPHYEDSDGEIDESPFVLKGLFKERHFSKEGDEYDPYANDIDFPPKVFGDKIREQLSLSVSEDEKKWYSPISDLPSLICEIWRGPTDWRDKEPDQSGHRIKASLSFLLHMCKELKCDLIFEMSIKRERTHSYREKGQPYKEPKRKIFILSANGELKDAKRSYRIG